MLSRALALLAPPLCAACADPCPATDPICHRCAAALAATRPGTIQLPGIETVAWAAPYEGVARQLVTALKFGHRLQLAAVAAERIAATLALANEATLIAVPPAPMRHRRRGFDPAQLIATELAARLGLEHAQPLRRTDGPRQVGRPRADRVAVPPRVRPVGPIPNRALLVDDVLTTGATLVACATALRAAGTSEIRAAVFAHSFGARRFEA